MICKNCGKEINNNQAFCTGCGSKVETIQNTTDNTVNNNMPPKSTDKKTIKIILFIILIGIGLVLAFFAGTFYIKGNLNKYCEDQSYDENTEKALPSDTIDNEIQEETYTFNQFDPKTIERKASNNDALTNGIEIKNIFFNPNSTSYGKTRSSYIYGKNNNSEPVQVTLMVEYYDSEGYRIDKSTSEIYVDSNQEFVGSFSNIKDDSLYKTAKLFYEAKKIKSYHTNINPSSINITANMTSDKNIIAIITNNSDKDIYADVSCLYYKNGEVVFANNREYLGLKQGETKDLQFYAFNLNLNDDYKNLKKIEFDDYKVFVNGARNSETKNY